MMTRFYFFLSDACIFLVHAFSGTSHAFLIAAQWFNQKAKDQMIHDEVKNL